MFKNRILNEHNKEKKELIASLKKAIRKKDNAINQLQNRLKMREISIETPKTEPHDLWKEIIQNALTFEKSLEFSRIQTIKTADNKFIS